MTPTAPIPDEVLRFLDLNVESIEQLELLRIVGESPSRQWSIQVLATKAQAPITAIAALEQRGLLQTQTIGSEVSCGIGSMTPETERLLSRLLQLYKERPVTLIKLVYARANERLKAFSDSFRLRKET